MTVGALESRRLSVGTIQRANRLSVHQRRLEVSHLILAHDLLVEVAEAGRLGYPSAQHVSSLVDQCFEPDRDTSGPGRWPVIPLAQLNPHTLLRRPRHLFRLGRTIDGPLDVQPGRRAAFNAHADCPRGGRLLRPDRAKEYEGRLYVGPLERRESASVSDTTNARLRQKGTHMPDFMTEWWFIITMIVLLLALIGVLMFLRNKRPEDE